MKAGIVIVGFIKTHWRMLAAVLSGLLLATAFPPLEIEEMAWVALVPLLIALPDADRPFALAFTAGTVFWLTTLYWLAHVTAVGWIVLALYCALYFGLFGILFSGLSKCCGGQWWANVIKMFAAAIGWSGFEWLRSVLFTGYSWNQIAVSQFANTVMIQSADLGGVYIVSALIVLMNIAVALTVERYVRRGGSWGRRAHVEMAAGLIMVAVAFAYGVRRVAVAPESGSREIAVALVQPNIDQAEKWDKKHIEMIYGRLENLTANAVPVADLVVWPETATPRFLRDSPEIFDLASRLGDGRTELLVGSMDYEIAEESYYNYFNSSFLIGPDGRMEAKYDKRHLVLFGEYVPFEEYIPFLKAFTPIEGSFLPGAESVIFRVGEEDIPIAVLICFEDAFPYLAASAVRAGARLLVNQTNDAWFDPSCGSRQHLAQSVFRSVENRVPMVRAANTGVSAWIDPQGRIRKVLTDGAGRTKTMGFMSVRVPVPPDNMELTFHTASGSLFGKCCAVVAISLLGIIIGRNLANRSGQSKSAIRD